MNKQDCRDKQTGLDDRAAFRFVLAVKLFGGRARNCLGQD